MLTGIVPGKLKKLEGDATLPQAGGHRIVLNMVDTTGRWRDDDFSKALSKRWLMVETKYRSGYLSQRDFKLGKIQEIRIRSDFTVINLICLEDGKVSGLDDCLKQVIEIAKDNSSSIHLPLNEDWLESGAPDNLEVITKEGLNVTLYTKPVID